MPISEENLSLLASIQTEWDLAEQDIKLAEQVCNSIVIPAIKELRYAGRRVVEVVQEMLGENNLEKIRSLLDDAYFDCLRARHDAIDAATAKIAIDIDIMTKQLTYSAILPAYPEFSNFVASLTDIRDQIVVSRNKRHDRKEIYSTISNTKFPDLVKRFNDLKKSESIMIELAKKGRREHFLESGG